MQTRRDNSLRDAVEDIRTSPLKAFQKRQEITALIVEDLKSEGTLFKTAHGFFYFMKEPTPKLYPINGDSIELSALISEEYGINPAEKREYEHIIRSLEHEALLRGRSADVHRLAHYDSRTGRLYVSRFNGWVYRLNGRTILPVPNGTDGVFFWDDPNWQPYEIFPSKPRGQWRHALLESLIFNSANFKATDGLSVEDERWLFSVWLRSHFFGSLLPTKPLLLICGEKGSGKTLAMRKWLKLLFGASGEVTSLERDKQDGFVAAVCSQPVVTFDNVDEHVGWLAGNLAQIATGISFKRRELYTTNTQVEYKPQCFIALNSRTPKFIEGRDDVLDRMLVLEAERFHGFRGEAEILEQIAEHRNSLWTVLLRGLNKLLSVTPPNEFRTRANFRMADFAGFAMAVARADGSESKATRILSCLEGRRSKMLLDDEPISLCLEKWLEKRDNRGRQVSSGDLQRELPKLARDLGVAWPYPTVHSLGQRLSHITTNLRERFEIEVEHDSAKRLRHRFWPRAETLNHPDSPIPELQPAKSLREEALA